MILCLDIGNSATKAGLFDGARLVKSARLAGEALSSLDEFATMGPLQQIGVASVVPAETKKLLPRLQELSTASPIVVSADLKLPFVMAYETPETLGADRIAAAAGAVALFPEDDTIITIDAGTAVTLEVVADGRFLGGAISPGPRLLHHALSSGTAQLPDLEIDLTASAIGRSTTEAIQAGVAIPLLTGLAGLISRIRAELGRNSLVIATGGWAEALAANLPDITHVEPHLVLHGIRELVGLNTSS